MQGDYVYRPRVSHPLSNFRVNGETGCWEWAGRLNPDGYGETGSRRFGTRLAHRAVLVALGRDPGPESVTDHLCRNRRCVNPDHLEIVTNCENTLRGEGFAGLNARKTECPLGHPLSGANLIVKFNRRSGRENKQCRVCQRVASLHSKHRSRGKIAEGTERWYDWRDVARDIVV